MISNIVESYISDFYYKYGYIYNGFAQQDVSECLLMSMNIWNKGLSARFTWIIILPLLYIMFVFLTRYFHSF